MAKVNVYNTEGKKVGDKTLSDKIFGVKIIPTNVHEVVVSMLSSARNTVAHTKTRGEVRGGGKKPWKQKGTGRARHGSSRSPIWAGGGITFGPRSNRNFLKKINRKVKRSAFFMTLSDKVANEKMILVEGLEVKDGKTKAVAKILEKLPVEGRVVFVTPESNTELVRGSRNIKKARTVTVNDISLLDVLNADCVVMTTEASDKLEKNYTEASA